MISVTDVAQEKQSKETKKLEEQVSNMVAGAMAAIRG